MKDEAISNSTFKITAITPAYHTSQTLELNFHINLSFQNSHSISVFQTLKSFDYVFPFSSEFTRHLLFDWLCLCILHF